MATKRQTPSTSKPKNQITVNRTIDEAEERATARVMVEPETMAAVTIQCWQGAVELDSVAAELKSQTEALKANDMHRAEAMLLAQAHTLDKLFNRLATRAHSCEYLSQFETNLKLALKAQNQCRMTLETLSNIKHPPVVYAKQANISNGPQQVNNGLPATHAAENQKQQTELLMVNHGETLDGGRTGETIGGNQTMEAVE